MKQCRDEKIGHLLTFYETGTLSPRQCRRFEKHLMDCDFCRQELIQMHRVFTALNLSGEKILEKLNRENLSYEVIRDQLQAKQAARSEPSIWASVTSLILPSEFSPSLRGAAVGVALTFAAVILLMLPAVPPANPFLSYLDYHKPNYSTARERAGIVSPGWNQFTQGLQLFQKNQFGSAVVQFRKAVQEDSLEGVFWLYLGLSYYLGSQADSALGALQQAVNLTEPAQKNRALWYLAQSYLLASQPAKSIEILKNLSAEGLEYSEQADSLLVKILPLYKGH
jgi:tetratricopeptide (TPR) repeat protein